MHNLYIKTILGKGRGVFANEFLKVGDIIEISPVVVYSSESIKNKRYLFDEYGNKFLLKQETIVPAEFINIVFNWSFLTKNGKHESCIALGYGSLYNSANPSNMRYEADEKKLNILFIATKDIYKDEEVTINYSGIGGNNISENNWWFENKNIQFI